MQSFVKLNLLGILVFVLVCSIRSTWESCGSLCQAIQSCRGFLCYWFILCKKNITSAARVISLYRQSLRVRAGEAGYEEVFFWIEEVLITTKYPSFCQVSWCQIFMVRLIMTETQQKNPPFHHLINVPSWSISSLYLSSLRSILICSHTYPFSLSFKHTPINAQTRNTENQSLKNIS